MAHFLKELKVPIYLNCLLLLAFTHTPLLVSRRRGVVWRRIWREGNSQIRQRLEIGWVCKFGAGSSLVQHLAGECSIEILRPEANELQSWFLKFGSGLIQEFLVEFVTEPERISEQKQPWGYLHPSRKIREVYFRWEHNHQYVNVVFGASPSEVSDHKCPPLTGGDYRNCFLTILPAATPVPYNLFSI